MRILVCGGRDFTDFEWMNFKLSQWIDFQPKEVVYPLTIIHGGARGADSLAGYWAKKFGYACEEYPADWNRYGKRAGPIRNAQMIREGKPDVVIAFPGGAGTMNMISQAVRAGIPTQAFYGRTHG
jgi:hypothetical protein